MSDKSQPFFPPEVLRTIEKGSVFSGGKRHHELVAHLLPANATWIDIVVPLSNTLERYAGQTEVVVFASGDPLFFGFANTLQRELPNAELTVYPSFNSLQLLAHRYLLPYQEMHIVSLTGRPWHLFDAALISGEACIGILTDRQHTPDAIARRMLDYGYDNYEVFVGECLGNEQHERCRRLTLEETANCNDWQHPNNLIVRQTHGRQRWFGIPDSAFHLLNGRAKMITKMPIRLLSLSMLELQNKTSFWDIGFCTGSVSVEAKLRFPHLLIHSFEVRDEGRELMYINSRRFGAPGIEAHIGDFLAEELTALPRPDAVFIGGHGGKMHEIVQRIHPLLEADGVIVFNSVSAESLQLFTDAIAQVGRHIVERTRIVIDEHNPIEILKAK